MSEEPDTMEPNAEEQRAKILAPAWAYQEGQEILRDGLVEKTRELQQELAALQSLVREYLAAEEACDDAETKYAVHYDDSDGQAYHDAMCQAMHAKNDAEQALRAAVPN